MKRLLILLVLCSILAGCDNNEQEQESVNDAVRVEYSDTSQVKTTNTNTTTTRNEYYYPDNEIYSPDIIEKDSDNSINSEEIKFKAPYSSNKTILNAINTTEENTNASNYSDSIDELNNKTFENKLDDTLDVMMVDDYHSFLKQRMSYDLRNKITYNLYENGIKLLKDVKSETSFNNSHDASLDVIVGYTQKNLEEIEKIHNTIVNSYGVELINAWKDLYSELVNYRDVLNGLDNYLEITLKSEELSFNEDILENFDKLLYKEVGDYSPTISQWDVPLEIERIGD